MTTHVYRAAPLLALATLIISTSAHAEGGDPTITVTAPEFVGGVDAFFDNRSIARCPAFAPAVDGKAGYGR